MYRKIIMSLLIVLVLIPSVQAEKSYQDNFTGSPKVWAVWLNDTAGFTIHGPSIYENSWVKSQTGTPEINMVFRKMDNGNVTVIMLCRYRAIKNLMVFNLTSFQIDNITKTLENVSVIPSA